MRKRDGGKWEKGTEENSHFWEKGTDLNVQKVNSSTIKVRPFFSKVRIFLRPFFSFFSVLFLTLNIKRSVFYVYKQRLRRI